MIRVWKENKCDMILEGHSDSIESMISWNRKLISGGYDKSIRIWNETGTCERVISGHTSYIFSLTIWRGRLVSGSEGKSIF